MQVVITCDKFEPSPSDNFCGLGTKDELYMFTLVGSANAVCRSPLHETGLDLLGFLARTVTVIGLT